MSVEKLDACTLCDEIISNAQSKRQKTIKDAVFVEDLVLCETHSRAFPTLTFASHLTDKCRVKPIDLYEIVDANESPDAQSPEVGKMYACYLLQSLVKPTSIYIGMTNDRRQRIRRHNGEIVGGAKATRANRPWRMTAFVDGFGLDQRAALRFEWSWKHPKARRLAKPWHGRAGRINCAMQLLKSATWIESQCGLQLQLFVAPDEDSSLCLSDIGATDASVYLAANNFDR